jgi:hypothetical protein
MLATVIDRRHGATRARRRWPLRLAAIAVVAIYPLSVLAYAYWHSLTSGLPGPRHGPQDAYRHARGLHDFARGGRLGHGGDGVCR